MLKGTVFREKCCFRGDYGYDYILRFHQLLIPLRYKNTIRAPRLPGALIVYWFLEDVFSCAAIRLFSSDNLRSGFPRNCQP